MGARGWRLLTETRRGEAVIALGIGVALWGALVVGFFVGIGVEVLLSLFLSVVVLVAMVRRPLLALRLTFVVVPASVFFLSLALTAGVPPGVVRGGALLKDSVVIAAVIAGYRAHRARGTAMAPLDRIALAYLGLVATWYLLTPLIALEPLTGDARLIALREQGLFVAMFLGVRWLAPTREERRRLLTWGLGAAAALALGGAYQWLDPAGFVQRTLYDAGMLRYYTEVAGLSGRPLAETVGWMRTDPVRVGSVLIAPFGFADMMVTAFAAVVATVSHRRDRRIGLLLMGLFALAVLWSGTRINLLALGAVVLAVVVDGRGMNERTRVQVLAVGLVAVLAFAPSVVGSRLLAQDNEESNEGHRNELTTAVEKIVDRPLGYGLGSDGAVQRRYEIEGKTVSGNTVLAVGVQSGVVTMAALVALLVAILRELEVRRRRAPRDELVRTSYLVLVGGLVAVSTHQGWLDLTSGTWIWVVVALGLPEVDEGEVDR
ncbi:MAG TPA: O-antigen ligase family protein [Iamia sp.]|nr:O-antigen ligase family protein [Iamia sp.]